MKAFIARSVTLLALLLSVGIVVVAPRTAFGQLFQRWCPPCVPCPTAPQQSQAGAANPRSPVRLRNRARERLSRPPPRRLRPTTYLRKRAWAPPADPKVLPEMVGDYLGGFTQVHLGGISQQAPLPGGAMPRFKMAEDTSPLPTTRSVLQL